MSDWEFLNKNRAREGDKRVPMIYWTTDQDGFMGMFRFLLNGKFTRCIASDAEGWKHVSVTIEGDSRPPSWGHMCDVKSLFWDDEEIVVQYHPKKSEYVNMHPGCLHLWSPTDVQMPAPPSIMVGL